MKNKGIKVGGFLIIMSIFIAPFIIGDFYKHCNGYVSLWEANDILEYYMVQFLPLQAVLWAYFSRLSTHRSNIEKMSDKG